MISVELDRESDGRWIAEAPSVPGALVYGATPGSAVQRLVALLVDVVRDRAEHGEPVPDGARVLLDLLEGA